MSSSNADPIPTDPSIFRCPLCKGPLRFDPSEASCNACGKHYVRQDDIPLFTDSDGFYEGKFSHTVKDLQGGYAPPLSWLFWVYQRLNLTGSRQRFLSRHLPHDRKNRILDIGCGGGHQALALFPHVVGVDLSLGSLQKTRALYRDVCVARLEQLPFASASFDQVVGMDLFGHIPPSQKEDCLKEIHRVLRPGGSLMLAVECDGENTLALWAKGFPDLYRRKFIQEDGHVGLEKAGAVLDRLKSRGFTIEQARGVEQNGYMSHWEFNKRFSGDYEEEEPRIRIEVRRAQFLEHHRLLGALNNLSLGILENLTRPFLPLDRANALLVAARKV